MGVQVYELGIHVYISWTILIFYVRNLKNRVEYTCWNDLNLLSGAAND